MAFCSSEPMAPLTQQPELVRSHSNFGDGYSVKGNNSYQTSHTNGDHRYQEEDDDDDEHEADYDSGATDLYLKIENKDWDGALSTLEVNPVEARTWIFRREHNSNDKLRWRLLPIHAVCIFRAPLALIEALLEIYPDGTQMKDDQGMLPVHLACRNGASKGVVLTLLKAFPESIDIRDRKGRTPTDLVQASSSSNKEAVLLGLRDFIAKKANTKKTKKQLPTVTGPDPTTTAPKLATTTAPTPAQSSSTEAKEVDYEHRTTLFRMILKKDWAQAVKRAESDSEEAATFIVTKGFNGNLRFLPLHKACVLQPTYEIIEALVKAYPEGVQTTDQDGWLPLHCACFYGADDRVIKLLLQHYNKAAFTKDDDGRLPLHYACLKGASLEVVELLLATHSKGAMAKDEEGRLPIHHACSKSAPESIVDALLKAAPKAAQSKDDQGRLPLHHACRKNASERVIRTLLRVYPRASQVKDDQDKLPIHYSCQHGASAAIVNFLLTSYPESVHVKNGFGYTPLAEAKALDDPKMEASIKVLEKFKKQTIKNLPEVADASDVSKTVVNLEEKVASLENALDKIADLGKALKKDLHKGKDPYDVLESFAEKLSAVAAKRDKTPLKSRNSTPSRGIFGRRKSTAKIY